MTCIAITKRGLFSILTTEWKPGQRCQLTKPVCISVVKKCHVKYENRIQGLSYMRGQYNY